MFKTRLIFSKSGDARYISHLDLMRVFQRSFARAHFPIWYTEGFNRHAYVSISLPLPVGFAGEREYLDFVTDGDALPPDSTERLCDALPSGIRALSVYADPRPAKEMAAGVYRVSLSAQGSDIAELADKTAELLADRSLRLIKKSKSGEKEVLLADFTRAPAKISTTDGGIELVLTLAAGQESLSPVAVTGALNEAFGVNFAADYVRMRVLDAKGRLFE